MKDQWTTTELCARTELQMPRKLFHMFNGTLIVALYVATGMGKTTAVFLLSIAFSIFLFLDVIRLRVPSLYVRAQRWFAPIMRSDEINRISGIPYYLAGALISVALFPKTVAVLSILFLAYGDPMASVFGILFGHKSPKWPNGKSLVGTLAGFGVCFGISLVFLASLSLPAMTWLLLAFLGGAAGAFAEWLPLDVDDNFSIPVISGLLVWLATILLNVNNIS